MSAVQRSSSSRGSKQCARSRCARCAGVQWMVAGFHKRPSFSPEPWDKRLRCGSLHVRVRESSHLGQAVWTTVDCEQVTGAGKKKKKEKQEPNYEMTKLTSSPLSSHALEVAAERVSETPLFVDSGYSLGL